MGSHEKNFALKVEELLSNITLPEYRQMIVEVCNTFKYTIPLTGGELTACCSCVCE